mgnify:CR=1 FL=1
MMRSIDQAQGLRRPSGGPFSDSLPNALATRSSASIVSITSGKGGVGKTQMAANLAVAAAQRGKRVALVDADLGLASLDLALGLKPTDDLLAVMRGEKTMAEVAIAGPCGIDLIPACPGRYEMANLGPVERNRLADAVEELSASYDLLIVDTGAGIGCNSVVFGALGRVILVVTPDPTSLRDAYAMAKVLHRRCGVQTIELLANQVASERDGVDVHARMQQIVARFLPLELRYLGGVPRDESVQRAAISGCPFILRTPDSLASRATAAIVERLALKAEAPRA